MRIYGPSDLFNAADTVRTGLNEGASQIREVVDLVPRLVALLERAEGLVDQIADVTDRADELVERAGAATTKAEELTASAESLVKRSEALLEPVESLAPKGLPMLEQVVASISPDEIEAIKSMFDRLPGMLNQVDRIGPDVAEILDSVKDLSRAASGIPGMQSAMKRGARKADEADEEGSEAAVEAGDTASNPDR